MTTPSKFVTDFLNFNNRKIHRREMSWMRLCGKPNIWGPNVYRRCQYVKSLKCGPLWTSEILTTSRREQDFKGKYLFHLDANIILEKKSSSPLEAMSPSHFWRHQGKKFLFHFYTAAVFEKKDFKSQGLHPVYSEIPWLIPPLALSKMVSKFSFAKPVRC